MKETTKVRILKSLGLFNIVRNWMYKFDSDAKKVESFFSNIISPGDKVYDIGANIGQKSDIFLKLNANVVAIEPQEECAIFLRNKYKNNDSITVLQIALDTKKGEATMYVCEANALSSFSKEWIDMKKKTDQYKDFCWKERGSIRTSTLDEVIKHYGLPKFCKIDVEGYEFNVLGGLTQKIPYLSFEIAPETVDISEKCINHLHSIGYQEFNYSHKTIQFDLNNWCDAAQIIKFIHSKEDNRIWGDIYARTS